MPILNYEYGSAIRETNGDVWDEEFFTRTPITREQLAKWNDKHAIANETGSVVVAVRRVIPEVEIYEPTA